MAIIIGTSGNNLLIGTPEADEIFGRAGDDLLLGLGSGISERGERQRCNLRRRRRRQCLWRPWQ